MKEKKPNFARVCIFPLILLVVFFSGSAWSLTRTTYIQRAGILSKGKHSISVGLAAHHNEEESRLANDLILHDSFNYNIGTFDLWYRRGIGHNLDFGIRWGSGGLGLDIKRSIIRSQEGWIPRLAFDLDFLVNNGFFTGKDFEGGIALSCITDRTIHKKLRLINSISLKYYAMNFEPPTEIVEGKDILDVGLHKGNVIEDCIILEPPVALEFFGKKYSLLFGVIPQFYLYKKTKKISIDTGDYINVSEYSHKYDLQLIIQIGF